MNERRPFVGGNWKMHGARGDAARLAQSLARGAPAAGVEIAVFPPSVHLETAAAALTGTQILLGAQNAYFEPDGAYTGEISLGMLDDLGVRAVLTGHSERRHVIGESDELVARKTAAALTAGMTTVLCVGERLEERERGQTNDVNLRQLGAALADAPPEQTDRLVVAYEPVWAIGTGRNATPDDAQDAHAAIRGALADRFSPAVADGTRIIYGGSVKPENAADLISPLDVDGFLVGGASLDPAAFLAICAEAANNALTQGVRTP